MSERIDNYRRQRALLQEHLTWLDKEITRLESGGTDEPAKSAVPPPLQTPPQVAPPSVAISSIDSPTTPAQHPQDLDQLAEEELRKVPYSSGNSVARAKFGCALVIIGMIALFIFLLFVLPNLIYG